MTSPWSSGPLERRGPEEFPPGYTTVDHTVYTMYSVHVHIVYTVPVHVHVHVHVYVYMYMYVLICER